MAIRKSFYYDPIRQGYDTNSWRTISGAPALVGSRLSVDNSAGIGASAIHYVDFVKGEMVFDVNVPTEPTTGTNRSFGAYDLGNGSYVLFSLGTTLTATCSDGVTTTSSSAITWDSAWTGTNTIFKIRWESGTAKFFIAGTQVAVISDDSVPYGPLSLYLADDSDSSMTIGNIVVKATQSAVYISGTATTDTSVPTTNGKLSMYQGVTVTESSANNTILIPELMIPYSTESFAQSVTVSENVAFQNGNYIPEFTQSVTISEYLTFMIDPLFIPDTGATKYESVTVSESITLEKVSY